MLRNTNLFLTTINLHLGAVKNKGKECKITEGEYRLKWQSLDRAPRLK
jgi:hypothetical protein